MVRRISALVGCALASVASAKDAGIPIPGGKYVMQWVENITVPIRPGYTAMPPELDGQLVITSFEAMPVVGKNAVFLHNLKNKTAPVAELPGSDAVNWPNAITGLPASVFGFPGITVGSGFLVPTHTVGGVWIMEASAEPTRLEAPVKITKDKSTMTAGWFYHMAVPIDMNGDGLQDMVTARCKYEVVPWGKKEGELLWLQQPKETPLNGTPWTEHHLADGPDFLFCMQPGQKSLALASAEYINEKAVYYYMHGSELKSRVIDDASGPGFSCSWEDINGDGRLELLATNHLNKNGSVFAYSFDSDDFGTAKITKHVLATGFSACTTKTGNASPGSALAFRPREHDSGKPHIFVSGDNSNSIFILVPNSANSQDWTYTKKELAYLGADIGMPSVGDVDGDGFSDLFVPAWDNNAVVHYKFTAASTEVHV